MGRAPAPGPVDEMAARVRAIVESGHPGDRIVPATGREDLDRLAGALNALLERSETLARNSLRFVADVSHELQSPLAALRAAVETCLRCENPVPAWRAAADEVIAQVERLSALVRDLGVLARLESGRLASKPEPLELASICVECGEVAQALGEPRGVYLDAVVGGQARLTGCPHDLRRAVLILLVTLVRRAPQGSAVRVILEVTKGEAILTVRDEGGLMDPADWARGLHGFSGPYCPGRDGAGLQLAIADRIARLHGGRLELRGDGGCTLTFRLPIHASDRGRDRACEDGT